MKYELAKCSTDIYIIYACLTNDDPSHKCFPYSSQRKLFDSRDSSNLKNGFHNFSTTVNIAQHYKYIVINFTLQYRDLNCHDAVTGDPYEELFELTDVNLCVKDQLLQVDPGCDTTICPGDSVTLGGKMPNCPDILYATAWGGTPPYKYCWDTVKTFPKICPWNVPFPTVKPTKTTTYYLAVQDKNDSIRIDSIKITVLDSCPCWFPYIFDKNFSAPLLSMNKNGNIAIAGWYNNQKIRFWNNNQSEEIVDGEPPSWNRIFIGKFSRLGHFQWYHSITGSSMILNDYEDQQLFLDDDDNTYLVIQSDTVFYVDTTKYSASDACFSVIKFGQNGKTEWVDQLGSWPKSPGLALSDSAIYLKGNTGMGFTYKTISVSSGFFIARINKDGTVPWIYQNPNWYLLNANITCSNNEIYLTKTDSICTIAPNGTFINESPIVPSVSNNYGIQFESGDTTLFYWYSEYPLCSSPDDYVLNSLKKTYSGGKIKFDVVSCDSGANVYPSFSCINNFAYIFSTHAQKNQIAKYDMNSGGSPYWVDDCLTSEYYTLATNQNKSYGYALKYHLNSSDSTYLNQLKLDNGDIGCFELKEDKIPPIANKQVESDWKYYPIPVNDYLTINYIENNIKSEIEIEIFNVLGVNVYRNNVLLDSNNGYKIDVSKLTRGFYIIRISSQGELLSSERFIKN